MARISATAKIAEPLRVYLLGSFRVERNAQTIHLPTRKVESLFAYLVLHPEQHPREKLAALLWGDSTDEQARHSLRTTLATLRKSLGDEILLTDRETVQLNPHFPLWLDACESQIAIDLYRGDLLADFYDDWILPEREHLRKIHLDALLQLAQDARSQSQYSRAIEFAQKVLASDPANEKAYQHIIFCVAATGDRVGALKQYDECEKKLRDELGVEPSKETIALRDQIEQALTGGRAREALFTNVPTPLTSFVGRTKELAELRELVGHTRLLTLTGAGGCGKTRLATELATELANANRFKHGVWWVELAALTDPAFVPQTVASVFDLREADQVPILTTLTNYLRAKELLLILDNCEHLIDVCAKLVDTLLHACPQLKILASSREALGIVGETPYRVPSLSLPPPESNRDWNLVNQSEAVQLFVARAQPLAPSFALTPQTAPSVAQICERLDGIPLALELAAARIKMLSVEQIAVRLDDRFRLLTGGSRTELPRHQTLRAAIDWSHSLLTEEERVLLRRLSVFAGGWTLEAAQAVCSCDPVCADDVLDLLARLVDKSLVIFDRRDRIARYRLMETIRQYVHDKLLEADEAVTVRGRHLEYYLKLAQEAEPKLYGSEQFVWLNTLDLEHNNLRAVLEWSLEGGRAEQGLELAAALLEFWELSAGWSEGRELVANLLTRPEVAPKNLIRANGLLAAGIIHRNLGDFRASHRYLEELIDIARDLGEPGKKPLALGLGYLGDIVFGENPSRGESIVEEGLAIARSLGTPWVIAGLLLLKGSCLRGRQDFPAAQKVFEESLALWQSIGNKRNAAYAMGRIGTTFSMQHDYATARWYIQQTLLFAREFKDRKILAVYLNSLGEIERVEGKYDLAKTDYIEALEVAREIGQLGLVAMFLGNLVAVSLHEGDIDSAMSFCTESLALARGLNRQPQIAGCLKEFAGMLAMQQKAERAAPLLAVVQTFIRSGDVRTWSTADEQTFEHYLALTRAQLDEATFNTAWAEGQKMTLEQATEYALESDFAG